MSKTLSDYEVYLLAQGMRPGTVKVYARWLAKIRRSRQSPRAWMKAHHDAYSESTRRGIEQALLHFSQWSKVEPSTVFSDEEYQVLVETFDSYEQPYGLMFHISLHSAMPLKELCKVSVTDFERRRGHLGLLGRRVWFPVAQPGAERLRKYVAARKLKGRVFADPDNPAVALNPGRARSHLARLRRSLVDDGYRWAKDVTATKLNRGYLSKLWLSGATLDEMLLAAGSE